MQLISLFVEPVEYSGQLKFKLDMTFLKGDGGKKNTLVTVDAGKMTDINKKLMEITNGWKETIGDHGYYIFDSEFNRKSSSDFIEYMIERNIKKDAKEIKLIINSPGGELASAFSMIDTMKGSIIPVATFGIGEIASCGLLLFISGKKGKRFITQNTSILSHQFSWGSVGKEHELFSTVKEYENTSKRIISHYKKCTGLKETDIKKILLPPNDVWLNAEEAIKYKIADKIVEFY